MRGRRTWKKSVPPAVAGGAEPCGVFSITSPLINVAEPLCVDSTELLAHPPAIAGGTDCAQPMSYRNGWRIIGPMETNAPDDGLSDFISVRPRLFGIAYRMLGSAVEAEDVVQDAWMRWQTTDRSAVLNPAAFLVTTTTRLSINVAESSRSRRETYVGPWLPEPIDTSEDPTLGAERGEALELALLLLLEKLTPTERAAYTLREAFDYPYREIADILQLTEAHTRPNSVRLPLRYQNRTRQVRLRTWIRWSIRRKLTADIHITRCNPGPELVKLLGR